MTTIQVEQRHIDQGWPQTVDKCPVALAIKGHLAKHEAVHVYEDEIHIGPLDKPLRLTAPPAVATFIMDFDCDLPTQPFEFDLPLPERKD